MNIDLTMIPFDPPAGPQFNADVFFHVRVLVLISQVLPLIVACFSYLGNKSHPSPPMATLGALQQDLLLVDDEERASGRISSMSAFKLSSSILQKSFVVWIPFRAGILVCAKKDGCHIMNISSSSWHRRMLFECGMLCKCVFSSISEAHHVFGTPHNISNLQDCCQNVRP